MYAYKVRHLSGNVLSEAAGSLPLPLLVWCTQFSNLCGSVYRKGNVLFTPDGNSLLSPVGNRITVFDLIK